MQILVRFNQKQNYMQKKQSKLGHTGIFPIKTKSARNTQSKARFNKIFNKIHCIHKIDNHYKNHPKQKEMTSNMLLSVNKTHGSIKNKLLYSIYVIHIHIHSSTM